MTEPPQDADTLRDLAASVRAFLTPHWLAWHAAWGPPEPRCLSQWTCLRSSAVLARAALHRGIDAALRSGAGGASGAGFRHGGTWHSHGWVQAGDWIVDITADQFSQPPIVVVPGCDVRYRAGMDAARRLPMTQAALDAVERLWPMWVAAGQVRSPGTARSAT
jgi:hypothetical protein